MLARSSLFFLQDRFEHHRGARPVPHWDAGAYLLCSFYKIGSNTIEVHVPSLTGMLARSSLFFLQDRFEHHRGARPVPHRDAGAIFSLFFLQDRFEHHRGARPVPHRDAGATFSALPTRRVRTPSRCTSRPSQGCWRDLLCSFYKTGSNTIEVHVPSLTGMLARPSPLFLLDGFEHHRGARPVPHRDAGAILSALPTRRVRTPSRCTSRPSQGCWRDPLCLQMRWFQI